MKNNIKHSTTFWQAIWGDLQNCDDISLNNNCHPFIQSL